MLEVEIMNDDDELLTADEIATILKVDSRTVSERYAFYPGFPKAHRLPSPKGQGVKRWKRSEIMGYIDGLKEAA